MTKSTGCWAAIDLMGGDLGRAVFLAYHARWRSDERSAEIADAVLARAVECASACDAGAALTRLTKMSRFSFPNFFMVR